MKRCSECQTEKPLVGFYTRAARCKPCSLARDRARRLALGDAYNAVRRGRTAAETPVQRDARLELRREHYARNREKINAQRLARYYTDVEASRAAYRDYHAANRDRKNALAVARYATNPKPNRQRARKWAQENPERNRERVRDWQRNNPDKAAALRMAYVARKSGAPRIEPIDRAYIIARDKSTCHICGKRVKTDITLDHLVPLSKGGNHTMDNLRVAHRACNSARNNGRLPAQLLLIA